MKMYAIFSREALKAMSGNRGKMAAQAGHAYLHAYWDAEYEFGVLNENVRDYRRGGKAVKICLVVDTTEELVTLRDNYRGVCGVSLVTDAGKTCFKEPTTTCLGLGPLAADQIGDDIKALKVLI